MRTRRMLGRTTLVALGAATMLGVGAPMAFAAGGPPAGRGTELTITCTLPVYNGEYSTTTSPQHGALGALAKQCEEAGGTATIAGGGEGE